MSENIESETTTTTSETTETLGSSEPVENPSLEKDPSDWTTGGEPMTGAQASYLRTLSEEAHEEFDEALSKAEASKRIDALQEKTGRGK